MYTKNWWVPLPRLKPKFQSGACKPGQSFWCSDAGAANHRMTFDGLLTAFAVAFALGRLGWVRLSAACGSRFTRNLRSGGWLGAGLCRLSQ